MEGRQDRSGPDPQFSPLQIVKGLLETGHSFRKDAVGCKGPQLRSLSYRSRHLSATSLIDRPCTLPQINLIATEHTDCFEHPHLEGGLHLSGAIPRRKAKCLMADEDQGRVRETIIARATMMARSGRFARCIDIEAALIPQFGYQALRADFRSPTFQNDIESLCREASRKQGES